MATVSSGEILPWQLFFSPTVLSANAVYLAAFSVFLLVAIFRLRTAPALGWLILYIIMQIVVFALRVYEINHDSFSRSLHRTMEGFKAISFLVLLQTLVILVSEHFATVDHFRVGMRRHSLFNHFLSALLIGAGIAGIYYAANLGEKRLDDTDRAYIVLLFIFLGLLLLHLLFRGPYLRYETTIFLFFLTLLCLVPVIYLELYHDRVANWTSTRETAFYVLWTLPQVLVTLGLLIVPLYTWYPEYRSAWIY